MNLLKIIKMMLTHDKTVAKVNKLKSSPTFQMSLGSKELFHSNFMCWMADSYRKPFANMLKELIGDVVWLEEFAENKILDESQNVPKYLVLREKNHYDFSIWEQEKKRGGGYTISRPVLILENKLKSVPNAQQLAEYEKNSGDANRILLYVIEPNFKNKAWKFLYYEDYVRLIKKHFSQNIKDLLSSELVKDYCDNFITNICNLVKEWNDNNDAMLDEAAENLARELRINDLREKMLFSKMAKRLRELLPNESLEISTGFSNGKALLDCKIKIDDNFKIGIQVQNMEYRRFLQCTSTDYTLDNLKDIAQKEYSWFFIDKPFSEGESEAYGVITIQKSSQYQKRPGDGNGEKMFCRYGDTFIYQYRNIKGDVTIEDVLDQIVRDVQNLRKNLKNKI